MKFNSGNAIAGHNYQIHDLSLASLFLIFSLSIHYFAIDTC